MGITKKQYEKLTGKKQKLKKPKIKIPKKEPKGVQFIRLILQHEKIEFFSEYRFHDVRKFRFDFAIPEHKIAIEYEGLNSKKSGHTTIGGYTSDCDKYNLAQINGWSVLRYTVINYKDIVEDLKQIINEKSNTN